ncbi:hypothetical protein [Streptomyces sp. NPDC006925]|uniref:hypothetical protein n=1 Tax=Streptomyces sp. NPDC006925 TaxID=3364768 RepID=UPI0036AC2F57
MACMEERCGISAASLSQAHSGRTLPSWRTVEGYVRACGGAPSNWHPRWHNVKLSRQIQQADTDGELLKKWARARRIIPPRRVANEEELVRLLNCVRRFHGLSLRDLARRAPGYSHHTYGAALRGERPLTVEILRTFLSSCHIEAQTWEHWLDLLTQVRPQESLAAFRCVEALRAARRSERGDGLAAAVEKLEERLEASLPILALSPGSELVTQRLRNAVHDVVAHLASRVPAKRTTPELRSRVQRMLWCLREGRGLLFAELEELVDSALPPAERQRSLEALRNGIRTLNQQAPETSSPLPRTVLTGSR